MTDRIVEVIWEDASSRHGWQSEEQAQVNPWIVHSLGYVLEDDERHIRIMEARAEASDSDNTARDHGCATSIPRSAVRKVTELARKR